MQPPIAVPQLLASEIVDCDFEKSFCNWKNETVGTQFNWTLNLNKKPAVPIKSGAENSNGYLYLELDTHYLGLY